MGLTIAGSGNQAVYSKSILPENEQSRPRSSSLSKNIPTTLRAARTEARTVRFVLAAGVPTPASQPLFPASSTPLPKSASRPPPAPKTPAERRSAAGLAAGSGRAASTSRNLAPRTYTSLWNADTTPGKEPASRLDPATQPASGMSSKQAKTGTPVSPGKKKSSAVQSTQWQKSLRNTAAEPVTTSRKDLKKGTGAARYEEGPARLRQKNEAQAKKLQTQNEADAKKLHKKFQLPMRVRHHGIVYRTELDSMRADAQLKARAETKTKANANANAIRTPVYSAEMGNLKAFFIPLYTEEVVVAAPVQLQARDQNIAGKGVEKPETGDSGNDSDNEINGKNFQPPAFVARLARNASRQAKSSHDEFQRLTASAFLRTPSEGGNVQSSPPMPRRDSGPRWSPVLRESSLPKALKVSAQPFLEKNPESVTHTTATPAEPAANPESKPWTQTARGTWEKKSDATPEQAMPSKATTVELTSNRRQGSRVAGMLEQQQKRQQAFNADRVKSVQLSVRPLRESSESAGYINTNAGRPENESARPGSIRRLIDFWENQ
jgi:hypothetical protein